MNSTQRVCFTWSFPLHIYLLLYLFVLYLNKLYIYIYTYIYIYIYYLTSNDSVTVQIADIGIISGIVPELYCSSNSVDQIKKNEMGGACGKYEGQERCIQGFGRET